jgi:broad specificity phosphatase PhoE
VVEALEAALALNRVDVAAEMLGRIHARRPGELSPLVRAQAARFGARLEATSADAGGAEQHFKTAAAIFREFGIPFWLAVTQLEHGELLVQHDRGEEAKPLLDEASGIFERLAAAPWLARAGHASGALIEAGVAQ